MDHSFTSELDLSSFTYTCDTDTAHNTILPSSPPIAIDIDPSQYDDQLSPVVEVSTENNTTNTSNSLRASSASHVDSNKANSFSNVASHNTTINTNHLGVNGPIPGGQGQNHQQNQKQHQVQNVQNLNTVSLNTNQLVTNKMNQMHLQQQQQHKNNSNPGIVISSQEQDRSQDRSQDTKIRFSSTNNMNQPESLTTSSNRLNNQPAQKTTANRILKKNSSMVETNTYNTNENYGSSTLDQQLRQQNKAQTNNQSMTNINLTTTNNNSLYMSPNEDSKIGMPNSSGHSLYRNNNNNQQMNQQMQHQPQIQPQESTAKNQMKRGVTASNLLSTGFYIKKTVVFVMNIADRNNSFHKTPFSANQTQLTNQKPHAPKLSEAYKNSTSGSSSLSFDDTVNLFVGDLGPGQVVSRQALASRCFVSIFFGWHFWISFLRSFVS